MKSLEENHAFVRIDGRRERASVCYASFLHFDNRLQEPQLHVHNLLANIGCTSTGEKRALDTKTLLSQVHTIGAVFNRELEVRLQALGYDTYQRQLEKGSACAIRGVSEELIQELSKRTEEINQYRLAHPEASKEEANNRTRKPKSPSFDLQASKERWKKELLDAGLTLDIEKTKIQPIKKEVHPNEIVSTLRENSKGKIIREQDIKQQVQKHASSLSQAQAERVSTQVKEHFYEVGSATKQWRDGSKAIAPPVKLKNPDRISGTQKYRAAAHSVIPQKYLQQTSSRYAKQSVARSKFARTPSRAKLRLYLPRVRGISFQGESLYSIIHSKLNPLLQKLLPKPKWKLSWEYRKKQYEKKRLRFIRRQKQFQRKIFLSWMSGRITRSRYVQLRDGKHLPKTVFKINFRWLTTRMSKRQRDLLISFAHFEQGRSIRSEKAFREQYNIPKPKKETSHEKNKGRER